MHYRFRSSTYVQHVQRRRTLSATYPGCLQRDRKADLGYRGQSSYTITGYFLVKSEFSSMLPEQKRNNKHS